jgi:hypothetical protein
LRKELPYLRRKYGVKRVAVFGSFARGTATESSDVDILVELARPLGLEFIAMADYLEAVLGHKVDLSTFECLRRSLQHSRYRIIARDVERSLLYVQED